jgi:hypothetical protein
MLPSVLCGCETSSPILREGHLLRAFKNREMRKIHGPNRTCRKLHYEELHNFYSSPNIIWMIKQRMRWASHAAHMGEIKRHTKIWWGNMKERCHVEDLGVGWRKILKLILK